MEGEENTSRRICTSSNDTSASPVSAPTSVSVSISVADSATGIADFLHPLRNPLILDTIFANFSFRELSWCRLVCKAWLEASLSKWRSSAALIIFQYDFQRACVGSPNKTNRHIPLETFVDNVNGNEFQLKEKPFRCLTLQIIEFPFESLSNLVAVLGDSITTLVLRSGSFRTVDSLRDLIYGHLPNLRKLIIFCTISVLRVRDLEVAELVYVPPTNGEHVQLKSLSVKLNLPGNMPPLPWIELLSHFPQLDSLNVSGGRIKNPAILINLLLAIKAIRQHDQSSLPLRTINYDAFLLLFPIDNGTLDSFSNICDLLRELQISLKCLKLKVGEVRRNGEIVIISELLEVSRRSLQTIQIMSNLQQTAPAFHLPPGVELDKLSELEITHGLCSNMEFLKVTPNLRELRIRNAYEHALHYNIRTDMVSRSNRDVMADVRLVHLRLLKVELAVSTKGIRHLTQWMPNVEILSVHLDNEQFPIICKQYWRNLKKLEVFGRELTDEGITGVGRGLASNENLNGEQGPSVLPNITWLKELQYFHCGSRSLTNVSVYNGFLKMPKLEHISFYCDLQSLELGDEAKNALRINNISLSGAPEMY